jgi:hypothetical protein
MNLPEILWTIAYCTFLLGCAWSFRTNGAWPAIGVMAVGVVLDASVAFLPMMGVESLSYGLKGMNGTMLASMAAGIAAYILFLIGVGFRWRGRTAPFHVCIALAQPVWFLSFIGFLYALYINPDALMR